MEGTKEADAAEKAIGRVLREVGLEATLSKRLVGPTLISFQVSAGRGSVQRLDRESANVEHKLINNHDLSAHYEKREGIRLLRIARHTPRKVRLGPLLEQGADYLRERSGRFVLGEATDGSVVTGDLGEPTSCHLLVAGMTGSGKSVLLRSLVTSMAHYQPPEAIRFTLVDPKRVSFGALKATLASHLANPLCFDSDQALQILESLVDEMEERFERIEAVGGQDIDDYNSECADKMARHVVVIDEYQDLTIGKGVGQAFEEVVRRLGAKARAAGIHLILATQRPDAKTMHPGIKANIPGKIALKVRSASNSRIILGEGGAEQLLRKGDMLADLGRGPVRAQCPLI